MEKKTYTAVLEVTVEAESLEAAKRFASNNLSVVDHASTIFDVRECVIIEPSGDTMATPCDVTITISSTDQDEGGYMYDIYFATADEVARDRAISQDGGQCTGALTDAIDMAQAQAIELVTRRNNGAVALQ